MKTQTLDQARSSLNFRLSTQAPGCPLRFQPCIVRHGSGYGVVELGQAERQQLEIVR